MKSEFIFCSSLGQGAYYEQKASLQVEAPLFLMEEVGSLLHQS